MVVWKFRVKKLRNKCDESRYATQANALFSVKLSQEIIEIMFKEIPILLYESKIITIHPRGFITFTILHRFLYFNLGDNRDKIPCLIILNSFDTRDINIGFWQVENPHQSFEGEEGVWSYRPTLSRAISFAFGHLFIKSAHTNTLPMLLRLLPFPHMWLNICPPIVYSQVSNARAIDKVIGLVRRINPKIRVSPFYTTSHHIEIPQN